ncbi:MAG TPA: asparagine synthase-related protein, partial [Chthonomonadales bacterium]|nr:asparagine synthase-related protein [Chthonomonadales bacterium]
FNKEFETRIHLRERWAEIRSIPVLAHPTRPMGYSCFASSFPLGNLETFDAGSTGAACEFRHPFFDLRLLRFLLAVPAVPWCRHKQLIRAALRGLIPEAVRLRPKTPLNGLPYLERSRKSEYPALPPAPGLEAYVDRNQVTRGPGESREEIDGELRMLGLHAWLASM